MYFVSIAYPFCKIVQEVGLIQQYRVNITANYPEKYSVKAFAYYILIIL